MKVKCPICGIMCFDGCKDEEKEMTQHMESRHGMTGTERSSVYCMICKESYLDFCVKHCGIEGSWELK